MAAPRLHSSAQSIPGTKTTGDALIASSSFSSDHQDHHYNSSFDWHVILEQNDFLSVGHSPGVLGGWVVWREGGETSPGVQFSITPAARHAHGR